MKKISLAVVLCAMGCCLLAQGQDSLDVIYLENVVVTGTKSDIPIEKSGKTIFKFTEKDLAKNQGKLIPDLLNELPGVQMNGNYGPQGSNISYAVRGASSNQSLILIDGVPFNDPTGITQTYDLRLLDINQVASIEVLQGGLSSLYGTGAAAGVINIILKQPQDGFNGDVNLSFGSFNTLRASSGISGSFDKFSYLVNLSYFSSGGFSAAKDEVGGNAFDNDSFTKSNLLSKLNYKFTEDFDLGVTVAFDTYEADFDGGAFVDTDAFTEQDQIRIGVAPTYRWSTGKVKASLFYARLDRLFDQPDFFDPDARFVLNADGRSVQGDLLLEQNLFSSLKFIGGLNYQSLSDRPEDGEFLIFNMVDPYASVIYTQQGFTFHVGGRLNNHSEYGSKFVYNLNPSYSLDFGENSLTVFTSYATSFVTPSLFQILDPNFGNIDLQPQESQSFDVGSRFRLGKFQLDPVFFYRYDDNLIIFTDRYTNGEVALETNGLEISSSYEIREGLRVSGHFTYTDVQGEATLIRVPETKFGFALDYQPTDQLSLRISHLHIGETQDFDFRSFPAEEIALEAYDLLDFSAAYQVGNFTFNGSVNNLLNEDYEEVFGFNTREINFTLGLNYRFQ